MLALPREVFGVVEDEADDGVVDCLRMTQAALEKN